MVNTIPKPIIDKGFINVPNLPGLGVTLNDAVVKPQRQDGNFKGSWDPIDVWGEDGGRVYSTASLVLTLEAYYRYSKLVR